MGRTWIRRAHRVVVSNRVRVTAALTTAVLAGACQSAPAAPTATQIPAPTAAAFTSATYGYSVTLPAGWTAIQATAAWDGTGAPGHDVPQADQFVGTAAASAWAMAAQTTSDLDGYVTERIAANAADHAATCPPTPEVRDAIKIGGEPGTLLGWNCGILINAAVTVHDRGGYLIGLRESRGPRSVRRSRPRDVPGAARFSALPSMTTPLGAVSLLDASRDAVRFALGTPSVE